MRAETKTRRVLDDRAIPNGVQVGGFAEIGQFDFVSTTVMVVVFGMHWLMNVADEMHNPFQRLKPGMLIAVALARTTVKSTILATTQFPLAQSRVAS